jgi:nucleoside-diphosphate-sugar epimerase
MRILVTGATGFIGVHLVKHLAEAGHDVIGVDIHPPHRAAGIFLAPVAAGVRFERADISDPESLRRAVDGRLDAVIHAAVIATSSGLESTNPERIVDVNIIGTLETLRFARTAGARRFVYISSSGVYGHTDPDVVLSEADRLQLTNIYPIAKYANERIVQWFAADNDMTAGSARIAAPYGAMERSTGTRSAMSPIYRLVRAALAGRSIQIRDPHRSRDWTHAADVSQALRLLAESPVLGHDCFNVSSGRVDSLAAVADILVALAPGFSWAATGNEGDIETIPSEERGPVDISRLASLGFSPRYTLEEGLRDTVTWIRTLHAAGIRFD